MVEQINNCLRCGHSWEQRGNREPVACPDCHSPYWNREKREIERDKSIDRVIRTMYRRR